MSNFKIIQLVFKAMNRKCNRLQQLLPLQIVKLHNLGIFSFSNQISKIIKINLDPKIQMFNSNIKL